MRQYDVSQRAMRVPRRDAERPHWLHFPPDVKPVTRNIVPNDHFVIQPNHNLLVSDPQADLVPASLFEFGPGGGIVFDGRVAVDVRQADHSTAPSTEDQRAILVLYRKR